MKPLQLIGCEHSYFTGKIRAYLLWSGLPFEEILSTTEVYRNIIIPKVGWAVVPVLVDSNFTETVYVQDTSDIIDYCEFTYSGNIKNPILPQLSCPKQRLACYCIELLGDLWLLIPAMHYRWNFPEQRDFLTHEWVRCMDPLIEPNQFDAYKKVASKRMTAMSSSLASLGITDETIPFIESDFEVFLQLLENHFKYHPYLLGGQPCLADFALIGPLYAHLYRDPVPGFILRTKAPMTTEWVDRMNKRTCHNQKSNMNGDKLFEEDYIPETLWKILDFWSSRHLPVLMSTLQLTKEFIKGAIGVELARGAGIHNFTIGEKKGHRVAFTFDIWMLQRVHEEINMLVDAGKSREVNQFLGQLQNGSSLSNIDLTGAWVHRRRCTKSQFGNNLYSGKADESTPVWVGGASKMSKGPKETSHL